MPASQLPEHRAFASQHATFNHVWSSLLLEELHRLGVRDIAALVEVLVDTRRLGLDIGAADTLERYAQWRRADNFAMVAATDLLNRLFSNDIAPVRLARDIGMAAVNRIGPLRRAFMHEAGGATGDLPRLLRGEPVI